MLPFCGDEAVVVALRGEVEAGPGLEAVEIGVETGCGCGGGTSGTIGSSGAEGAEPSERDLRESEEEDLGHARAAVSASAGHDSSPPMMPPTGAGGGGGTFHAVFLAAALPGSAPSACAAGSRGFSRDGAWGGAAIAAGASPALAAGCVGAAPPAAGDMAGRRGTGAGVKEERFWIAI